MRLTKSRCGLSLPFMAAAISALELGYLRHTNIGEIASTPKPNQDTTGGAIF
jgi:hypothetical protein